jgi:hypothetical protein
VSDVWLPADSPFSSLQLAPPTEGIDSLHPTAGAVERQSPALSFSGVCIVQGVTRQPNPATPLDENDELELDFDDDRGVVLRAATDVLWAASWPDLASCSTPERVVLSNGARGVLLEAVPRHHPALLAVLPARRPRKAELAIRACVRRHDVPGRRSSPRWPVWAGALAAVAALVAACLLAAGHAIHF